MKTGEIELKGQDAPETSTGYKVSLDKFYIVVNDKDEAKKFIIDLEELCRKYTGTGLN